MRIGASGAAYGGRSSCGKKRQEKGAVEREDKEDKSEEEGGEGEDERADKCRLELGRERPGKQRTRTDASGGQRPWTGTSREGAAMDRSVRGRGCERVRAWRRQETARRTRRIARKVEREDKKKKSREEGGEGDAGVTGRRMKPGLEHLGKMCAWTGTTEWWRPLTGTSGSGAALDWSVRGCIRRKEQRRRGAHAQEQATVEREIKRNKCREAGGGGEDGEADKRMAIGLEHPGHEEGVR